MSKIKQDIVNEIHKPVRRKFPRRRTILKAVDDLWQADLAEFTLYSRENKGFKYILIVIDCFSKYLWTAQLKTKSGPEVAKAFDKILLQASRIPKNLQTDNGTEFYNKHFQKVMDKHNINHYSTFTVMKASMAERVIRTLKDKLYRLFSMIGKYRWYNSLAEITKDYNEHKHSTTGMPPCNIIKGSYNEKHLLQTVYSNIKTAGIIKLRVGNIVRISKQKMLFEKGYTPNWSTELFKILKIKISMPTTYLLEDMRGQPIQGAFYAEELQKVLHDDVYLIEKELKKKNDKIYVKWLGLDKTHNSWINKSNIV